jgi:hypothetical protein
LQQFPNGWPVEEFLKTYLKNKRTYARKQGYLKESNQKQESSDESSSDEDVDAENGKDGAEGGSELDSDEMYAQA